jgi:hypothetical protein
MPNGCASNNIAVGSKGLQSTQPIKFTIWRLKNEVLLSAGLKSVHAGFEPGNFRLDEKNGKHLKEEGAVSMVVPRSKWGRFGFSIAIPLVQLHAYMEGKHC